MTNKNPDEWMSTGQIAKELGFSSPGVIKWIDKGTVFDKRHVRITPGGYRQVRRHEVERVKHSLIQNNN